MKSILNNIVIVLFFLPVTLNCQALTETPPEGMQLIPEGNYIMHVDQEMRAISVSSFWMSNEITNKEYRKYVEYAIIHPQEEVCVIDVKGVKQLLDEGTLIDEVVIKKNTQCFKFSDITFDIIDTFALNKFYRGLIDFERKYKNYFIDKEYDNYPVVGVPFRHAQFYCIWRANQEKKNSLENNQQPVHSYRLPMDVEWTYVASGSDTVNYFLKRNQQLITESNSGEKNIYNLTNFIGNVSEWVINPERMFACDGKKLGMFSKDIIIRGGSINFVMPSGLDHRVCAEEGNARSNVGFRIVRSYTGNKVAGL